MGERPDEPVFDSPTGWVARHVRRYVETDGAAGHLFQGVPSLLLTTRGRTTGVLRRTALYYGRAGERNHYVVVASNGGAKADPAWYLNLVADPRVTVQVGAERFGARARVAAAEERPALWRGMVELFGMYERYAAKAEREIPVVVLERERAG